MRMSTIALAVALAAFVAAPQPTSAAAVLEKGYRAFSLPLDSLQLQGLKSGDRIDVMITFEVAIKSGKEWVTATILQNALVLEVRLNAGESLGSLFLALNPNEVQYAALAVDTDKNVRVSLRAEGDAEMKPMEMAAFRKLFR